MRWRFWRKPPQVIDLGEVQSNVITVDTAPAELQGVFTVGRAADKAQRRADQGKTPTPHACGAPRRAEGQSEGLLSGDRTPVAGGAVNWADLGFNLLAGAVAFAFIWWVGAARRRR